MGSLSELVTKSQVTELPGLIPGGTHRVVCGYLVRPVTARLGPQDKLWGGRSLRPIESERLPTRLRLRHAKLKQSEVPT